jgi:hypothetical protein
MCEVRDLRTARSSRHCAACRLIRWLFVLAACVTATHAVPVRAEVDGNWVDFRKLGSIFVRAEFRLDRYDDLFATIKEQQADVSATLALKITDNPIVISLFANRRSYVEFMSANEPLGVRRRALFIKKGNTGNVFLYRHMSFETDLRHEVTHAMLHAILPFIPLWLDEGLAEYFEVRAEKRASKNGHQARMKWSRRLGWKPNLRALEAKNDLSQFTTADYRESWVWVHFMMHGPPEANQLLKRYLRSIQQNKPPGELSSYLRHMYESPAEQALQHLKRWK